MASSVTSLARPEGFVFHEDLISLAEQAALVYAIEGLPLREFEFHGHIGKRRTLSFGWHYSFADESLRRSDPIPDFLFGLRKRAAHFAGLEPNDIPHVLLTEYSPGTPIGWHRDKGVFEDVIGVSLLSACRFRLRKRTKNGWERFTQVLAPRSAYLLRGEVRTNWEHSIPPVEQLRYSITFRSLAKR